LPIVKLVAFDSAVLFFFIVLLVLASSFGLNTTPGITLSLTLIFLQLHAFFFLIPLLVFEKLDLWLFIFLI